MAVIQDEHDGMVKHEMLEDEIRDSGESDRDPVPIEMILYYLAYPYIP